MRKAPKEFWSSFKGVSGGLQGRFRAVQMKFPWCFKKVFGVEVLGVCWEHFKGVSRKLEGVLGVFLRLFEESSKGVSKQFQGGFWRVSRKFLGVLWKCQRSCWSVWKFRKCFKEFPRSFRKISGRFQVCFKSASRVIQVF